MFCLMTGAMLTFFVRLNDGREFAFTAFTQDNIKHLMQQDDQRCFVSPGLVIVRDIDIESILACIEQCLVLSNNYMTLDHFGVMQR